MRTIKFRGKRLDNGEWLYGDYHKRVGGVECIIEMQPNKNGKVEYVVNQVDPDTVGQFTGFHDTDGTEVYEGDIVATIPDDEFSEKTGVPLEFVNEGGDRAAMYAVIYGKFANDFGFGFYGDKRNTPYLNPQTHRVIGNIHDNPELMKQHD